MKIDKIVFGSFFILGIIFIVIGIVTFFSTQNFLSQAKTTQGTVKKLFVRSSGISEPNMFYPQFSFTASDGKEYLVISRTGSNPSIYKQGQTIEVIYNPQNPNDAKINSPLSLWLITAIFTFMGLVSSIVGFRCLKENRNI